MRLRTLIPFAMAMAISWPARPACAQFVPSTSDLGAISIPSSQLIQAADLAALIAANNAKKAPVVIQVGSHVFFNEAHITGSVYAGPGTQSAGLALLEKAVSTLRKDTLIVIYCGCCPWNRCPNVSPAYIRLNKLGYTNVKVLYLANNFGDDWVSKGYPTQK
jgi:thiosulfate/3-mercaptopyruvate sulfurtransferase